MRESSSQPHPTEVAGSGRSQPFVLLPAIDLRAGRVVRLVGGDFDRETRYATDPLAVAEDFAAAGARWLHVVDLDAARDGRGSAANRAAVRAILAGLGGQLACQLGGGIRSRAAAEAWLEAGVRRVVLGTALLRTPELGAELVAAVGADRVAAALDVRGGRAVGEGWRPDASGVAVEAALEQLAAAGVATFVVTAIDRDGRLAGPDLDLLGRLVRRGRGAILASGGIRSLDDLAAVAAVGCAGAIVGRALYEGRLDLAAALRLAASLDGAGTATPPAGAV
jgi:phosphoribosylformimino-5-aminoimidazole carboxamide ribotide isomerase